MSIENLLNVVNLKTARENAGFSTESATSKVSTSKKDLVAEWEKGSAFPTLRQIENLAKEYQISPLLVLSNKPIPKHRVIPDYRAGDQSIGKDKINKLINLVVKRQGWLEQKLQQIGYSKNRIVGSGRDKSTPDDLASFIIQKLSIDHDKIISFSGNSGKERTLKYYIDILENKQIFVGKTLANHRISVSEMRGLFIKNNTAPFIVLNRKDSVSAQIFTLAHEMAHLFRATEGISKADFRTLDDTENSDIDAEEVFCNKTAAAILIPANLISGSNYREAEIRSLAAHFNVSNLFAFYRLKTLNKIQRQFRDELENIFIVETAEAVRLKEIKASKSTGGSHVNNMRDSNGGLFNRIVQEFYSQNEIGYSEASNVLKFSAEQV